MVRTDVYESTGGLDPEFFAHMEEIDLCWRIKLAGHDIAAIPRVVRGNMDSRCSLYIHRLHQHIQMYLVVYKIESWVVRRQFHMAVDPQEMEKQSRIPCRHATMKKPIAVIILNWNGEAMLRTFLPAVILTTPTDIASSLRTTVSVPVITAVGWLRNLTMCTGSL